jgi:hypothetical protein
MGVRRTVWLIASIDTPTIYIGAENWMAYQRLKAKQFGTQEEAREHLRSLNLAPCWEIISYTTESL